MQLSIGLVIAGWCAGWLLLAGVHPLPRRRRTDHDLSDVPTVSVVVPARDEALRLPGLLRALAASRGVTETIVVDDGSTDGTAALASAAGARVVPAVPPPGWTGKANACHTGALAATGDVVVFLDADTSPDPTFVRDLAARAASTGGLVSVQPWHRVHRVYEHASAVCNVVAVLGAGTGTPSRHQWWRGPSGFGPAMAIERSRYETIGGHGSVRRTVIEDLALARCAHRRGLPVEAWMGHGIEYRMYPEGSASLLEGWTKNLSAGASSIPPLRAIAVGLWITAALSTVAVAGRGPIGIVVTVAMVAQALVLFRRVGSFGVVDAILLPALTFVFVAMFLRSTVRRVARRPVWWRGRIVPEEAS